MQARSRLAIVALVLATLIAAAPVPAFADGDPASDVLATQALFLPQDAAVPGAQQAQLAALLEEAARGGYPIRVALVASPIDLGSVTALWRQPAGYARFLGQELSLTYHGRLLVVMPNGLGGVHTGQSGGGNEPALRGLSVRPGGAGLALTALAAVRQLAADAGHPLPLPEATASGHVSASDPWPWIAFAVGAALMAAAWAASLRARPLRRERGEPQPRSA
jgi:hypothetical protein